MKYLYCRVSTQDKGQDFVRQHYVMEQKGLEFDNVFEEKISGTTKTNDRNEFEKMVKILKPGDEIYFESLSRVGRSLGVIFDTINFLVKEKKVRLIIIKENLILDPDEKLNAMTSFMLNIFASISQLERDLLSERISEKLQAMKREGVKLGCPGKMQDEEKLAEFKVDYMDGMPYAEMQKKYELSKPSVIATAKRLGLKPRNNRKASEQK